MSARGAQLALEFPLSARSRFESFTTGRNAEVVRRLGDLGSHSGFAGCFLYGAPGVGRTHLLQAVCHRFGEAPISGTAIYLPLADPAVSPGSLDGLETLGLVALDDVDAWLGLAEAERALLALYQGLEGRGGRLLISARAPAVRLGFRYADLGSRLRALPAYELLPLEDTDKALVLKRLAGERGLVLADAVVEFWLARSARDLRTLVSELDRLDAAAMAEQRRVTVPLVKQVLGL